MKQNIKPFIKWVGGKGKIIPIIEQYLPDMSKIETYVEPFVGGGALLFHLLNKKYEIKDYIANDINQKLINAYTHIKENHEEVIELLSKFQFCWEHMNDEQHALIYYAVRGRFNENYLHGKLQLMDAVDFIFLNKTCFNGLYRENSLGLFNVPIGRYENPLICDEETIKADSEALQNVTIMNESYEKVISEVKDISRTFFYLDPPYMPITKTASFTSYSKKGFTEEDQMNVKEFCDAINRRGGKFMLSNSHPENSYFEVLYKDYNVNIIEAPRVVSAKSNGRKKVQEVLITNYEI